MLRLLIRCPPLRRLKRYIHERRSRVEGLPKALAFETLDAVCREHGRGAVKRCWHLHLSGWKSHGTYRLELVTETGTSWRLIFKDECYWPQFIPALDGLPACPGPPEAVIYRTQNSILSPFLPQLFWFREVELGHHFQYLLEDLAETHAKLAGTLRSHTQAARSLVQLQRALRGAYVGEHPDGLIRYDRRFSEGLLDYAATSLVDYLTRTADSAVAALWDRWHNLESVHQRDEFYNDDLRVPVHGDFNFSNIHVPHDNTAQLKVVDWEWAGVGLPHADIAALAKSVNRDYHSTLLQAFVEEDRRLDAEQHWRLFYWCRLERRLLDAAFLARQQLGSARHVSWLQREIRRSAGDVLAAVASLSAGKTRAATRVEQFE